MRTLAGRVFLVLVLATLLIQVLSFGGVLAFSARESRQQMYEFMAADLLFLRRFLASQPPEARAAWMPGLDRGFYQPTLAPAGTGHPEEAHPLLAECLAVLQRRLGPAVALRPVRIGPPGDSMPAIEVALDAAHTLVVRFPSRRPPLSPPPLGVIAGYAGLLSLAVMLVAWFGVRLATRPLQRLAQAARTLEQDLDAPPLAEDGPVEVAAASRAFNRMQRALQKNLAERTRILASISHDLKTPLTRLRLRVGTLAPHAEQARIEADIDAMESLVQEGLDYARSAQLHEARVPVDLQALIESVAEQAADLGQEVVVEGRLDGPVHCAPRALLRALQNVVDNALKYGGNARIRLAQRPDGVSLRIEDDGPGLPEALLERVFEPFFRVEDSRNRNSGGTGLGLAIAHNLLHTQGGSLWLENRPGGGLAACLVLPAGRKPGERGTAGKTGAREPFPAGTDL